MVFELKSDSQRSIYYVKANFPINYSANALHELKRLY
jgi:hypothetical protein